MKIAALMEVDVAIQLGRQGAGVVWGQRDHKAREAAQGLLAQEAAQDRLARLVREAVQDLPVLLAREAVQE